MSENVAIVSLAGARFAIRARHIDDIVTLPYVTIAPTMPPEIGGLVNLKGTVVPVLCATDSHPSNRPRQGGLALLFTYDKEPMLLAVDEVLAVTSAALEDGAVTWEQESLPWIAPAALYRQAAAAVANRRGHDE